MKKKESNATPLQKVLRVLALLAVIGAGLVLFMLLFSFVPMAFMQTNVALDTGGVLDSVLVPAQHGSAVISGRLLFCGALPLLTAALFVFCWLLALDLFCRGAAKRGAWLYPGGRVWLGGLCVCAALLAAVPRLCSALAASAIAQNGAYQVIPWNPLGGAVLFALSAAAFIAYSVLLKRRGGEAATPQEDA